MGLPFYRAMHCSAKRGIAIACPSVRDVGGSASHRLEIARTISLTPSLFVAKGHPPNPRGTWGNFKEKRCGEEKWRAGAQKWQYL